MHLSDRPAPLLLGRHQRGGIQEKLVLVVLLVGAVLGFSVVMNFVEVTRVKGLLNDTLMLRLGLAY